MWQSVLRAVFRISTYALPNQTSSQRAVVTTDLEHQQSILKWWHDLNISSDKPLMRLRNSGISVAAKRLKLTLLFYKYKTKITSSDYHNDSHELWWHLSDHPTTRQSTFNNFLRALGLNLFLWSAKFQALDLLCGYWQDNIKLIQEASHTMCLWPKAFDY